MQNIYQAIAAIMKETEAVGKDKVNKTQNFKYRGIDQVMNAYNPILAKNGVFIVPEVIEQTREERETKNHTNLIYSILKIRYRFYAEDGSYVDAVVIGEGMDSGDKASNKAMAVAMKYALFQVFCIPTEEMGQDDPDGYSVEESHRKGESPKSIQPTAPAAPKCHYCGADVIASEGGGKWHGEYACGACVAKMKAEANANRNN